MDLPVQKIVIIIAIFAISLCTAGCADLATINAQLAHGMNHQSGGIAMATQMDSAKPVQLGVSKDKRVIASTEEAMPTIRDVLAIHQCVQNSESQRLLNVFAVPGADMAQMGGMTPELRYPNNHISMKFHDRSKCVNLIMLDQWMMPALNGLQFRAVYFADDSGETISYLYLFKKMDDGSWKLAQFNRYS